MTVPPATAPVDVVAKLSTTLAIHHAPHLLPGVLACLAPYLQPCPSEGGRRVVDVTAVLALAKLLAADGRPDLLTCVLLAATPWLPDPDIPPTPTPPPGLTALQTAMLQLVSYGMSNSRIGQRLFTTEEAVKSHLSRAYQALGAADRAHAMRLGFECGALKFDTD